MNSYELSRRWFDYAFKNPRLIRPLHHALYFWCIERANRLSWPDEFQLPTDDGCHAIGVADKETFHKALKDLHAWGAIRITQDSVNRFTARYITLANCEVGKTLNEPLQQPKKPDAIPDATTDAIPVAIPDADPTKYKPTNLKTLKPKNNTDVPSFDVFWEAYGKKVGKPKAVLEWNKLTADEKEKAVGQIPAYQSYQPDPKLRKDPERFLKYKAWEDEYPSGGKVKPMPPSIGPAAPTYQDLLRPEFKTDTQTHTPPVFNFKS